MPGNKNNIVEGRQAWSLADHVEEIRGKFLLKKKDSDSYWESTKNEIKEKEAKIAGLRQENRAKRITLAQDENGDERVIKTVFMEDRKVRLSLQRKTASGAIHEMDQTVCEGAKFLNELLFERQKREKKLKELQEAFERKSQLSQTDQLDEGQTVTRLENDLDKALIKYDTARVISQRYEEIVDTLKEESLQLPARLSAMEQALLEQNQELQELKVMAKDAMQGRDEAKAQLSQVERSAYGDKRRRDAELAAARKEVERRKEQVDKVEKKVFQTRPSFGSDRPDQKSFMKQQKKWEAQKKILTCEEAYQAIRQATYVTDIEDVIERVKTQSDTMTHLKQQVQRLESDRNRLQQEKQGLQQQYHEMKYTGEKKLSRGQKLLEQMEESLRADEAARDGLIDRTQRLGNTVIQVKSGITALLNKLKEVKLLPPGTSYTPGDMFEEAGQCIKKLEKLQDKIKKGKRPSHTDAALQQTEFHDFLEAQLPADNVRIKFVASDDNLSEFDIDCQDNEETLSRSDIKQMGQKLLDTKLRPKKRRTKKK